MVEPDEVTEVALAKAKEITEQLARWRGEVGNRAVYISLAVQSGLSYSEVGRRVGLSPSTVRDLTLWAQGRGRQRVRAPWVDIHAEGS